MSEFKGTPGPWKARNLGTEIAVFGSYRICGMTGGEIQRDKANAHLIAAAPELLEALRLVREDIVVAGGHDNYCAYVLDKQDWRRDGAPQSERPPCNCWQADALRKIDAAIAKALNTDTKGEGHE